MPNTNHAVSRWLAQGDRALESALQHCYFQPSDEDGHLEIHCPQVICDGLHAHLATLDWQASRTLIKSLDVYGHSDGVSSHAYSLIAQNAPKAIAQQGVDVLGLKLLARLGVSFDNPIAIVEMGSNRGIFCTTEILTQSRARSLDRWHGEDMAKYHYPEGLRTLEKAWEAGRASGVEWIAKTFDLAPVELAANVYAAELNGKPVRVVENLHWRVIASASPALAAQSAAPHKTDRSG